MKYSTNTWFNVGAHRGTELRAVVAENKTQAKAAAVTLAQRGDWAFMDRNNVGESANRSINLDVRQYGHNLAFGTLDR